MTADFSLSIFVIETDLKPIIAFSAKWQRDAEIFFRGDEIRSKIEASRSGGQPLSDQYSILRLRLANAEERAFYLKQFSERPAAEFDFVFLLDVDTE